MARDRFFNPLTGITYSWQRNHEEEDESGKQRAITHTANTGNVGLVRQQGEESPWIITWRGKIFHRSQFIQFWDWFRLCKIQTIHLIDFDDQGWEVQIIDLRMKRTRKLTAASPDATMRTHYYEYTIVFEVYDFLSGDLVTAGVDP